MTRKIIIDFSINTPEGENIKLTHSRELVTASIHEIAGVLHNISKNFTGSRLISIYFYEDTQIQKEDI